MVIPHMICGGQMKVVLDYYIHYQIEERKKQSGNENKRMGENIRLNLQRLLYC